MPSNVFPLRRPVPSSRCEHCGASVDRVWLVPGDVLDSCRDCYRRVMGAEPREEQGHSRPAAQEPQRRAVASFYLRADGRRPA